MGKTYACKRCGSPNIQFDAHAGFAVCQDCGWDTEQCGPEGAVVKGTDSRNIPIGRALRDIAKDEVLEISLVDGDARCEAIEFFDKGRFLLLCQSLMGHDPN